MQAGGDFGDRIRLFRTIRGKKQSVFWDFDEFGTVFFLLDWRAFNEGMMRRLWGSDCTLLYESYQLTVSVGFTLGIRPSGIPLAYL